MSQYGNLDERLVSAPALAAVDSFTYAHQKDLAHNLIQSIRDEVKKLEASTGESVVLSSYADWSDDPVQPAYWGDVQGIFSSHLDKISNVDTQLSANIRSALLFPNRVFKDQRLYHPEKDSENEHEHIRRAHQAEHRSKLLGTLLSEFKESAPQETYESVKPSLDFFSKLARRDGMTFVKLVHGGQRNGASWAEVEEDWIKHPEDKHAGMIELFAETLLPPRPVIE